jgi:antitoxin component YwqK of YwqJK toxin-antitoxin module
VALALSAGLCGSTLAETVATRPAANANENIFLGEIERTEYSEPSLDPGVVGEVELIRERYPDGKVLIERQVTLNGEGNYVNHGAWKQYSTKGDVIAEGQYNFGQRIGLWTRWIGQKESKLFNELPFKQFKPPFMSQANFAEGKMDGEWIVTDANERKVMAVSLKNGERHGTATTWLPNGNIYMQMTYDQSIPVGDMLQANTKTGELQKIASYDRGHRVITKSEHYPSRSRQVGKERQLKSEVMYLAAKSVMQSPDDFWTMTTAKYEAEGEDLRHGTARTWYANGQPQQDGFYTNGKKTGTFTYWHENGQVYVIGEYRDDLAEGTWTWWHDNGQKSAVGKYEDGKLVGEWRWWDPQGQLTKHQTYTGTESAAAEPEEGEERVDVSNLPVVSDDQF